jgi:carbamoyl-phosphate synthase large subunit
MTPMPSNLLVTCGGKWVGIVLQLREAMQRNTTLKRGRIVVASSDELTPAGCFADQSVVVPPIKEPDYVPRLLEVSQDYGIRIVVPLIDVDLERLAPHLDRFAAVGTTVICPPPDLVELCLDKLKFAQFAEEQGLRHPRTRAASTLDGLSFPAFYKKRRGFGSIGSGICRSAAEAEDLAAKMPDLLFQEYLSVQEITVDAYISREGKCIVCVPRIRDKVVAGEAYQTHTVRRPAAVDLALRTISGLARRGLRGPLNVQMFDTDPPCLIEVNTRLGSASVLSNVACQGLLLDALLHEALGGTADGDSGDYTVGLALSRFLGDVFHKGSQIVDIKPR